MQGITCLIWRAVASGIICAAMLGRMGEDPFVTSAPWGIHTLNLDSREALLFTMAMNLFLPLRPRLFVYLLLFNVNCCFRTLYTGSISAPVLLIAESIVLLLFFFHFILLNCRCLVNSVSALPDGQSSPWLSSDYSPFQIWNPLMYQVKKKKKKLSFSFSLPL